MADTSERDIEGESAVQLLQSLGFEYQGDGKWRGSLPIRAASLVNHAELEQEVVNLRRLAWHLAMANAGNVEISRKQLRSVSPDRMALTLEPTIAGGVSVRARVTDEASDGSIMESTGASE